MATAITPYASGFQIVVVESIRELLTGIISAFELVDVTLLFMELLLDPMEGITIILITVGFIDGLDSSPLDADDPSLEGLSIGIGAKVMDSTFGLLSDESPEEPLPLPFPRGVGAGDLVEGHSS